MRTDPLLSFVEEEMRKIWEDFRERRKEEGHATTSLVIELHMTIREKARQFCEESGYASNILDINQYTNYKKREECKLFKKIQTILQKRAWTKEGEEPQTHFLVMRESSRQAVIRGRHMLTEIEDGLSSHPELAYELNFQLEGVIDVLNELRRKRQEVLQDPPSQEVQRRNETPEGKGRSSPKQMACLEEPEEEQLDDVHHEKSETEEAGLNEGQEEGLSSPESKKDKEQDIAVFVGNLTRGKVRAMKEVIPDFSPRLAGKLPKRRKPCV